MEESANNMRGLFNQFSEEFKDIDLVVLPFQPKANQQN